MWIKYDTMSESLQEFLLAHFPKGQRAEGKFFVNESTNIRVQDYLVIIECNNTSIKKRLQKELTVYSTKHNSHFILLFIDEENNYEYVATSSNSEKVLSLLLSITNLSPTFDFVNKIFYKSSCEVNMQYETINYYSDTKCLVTIKTLADVELFNTEQKKLLSEVDKIKQDILKVVRKYDKRAYFSKYDILDLYCQGFVCKFQKNFNYWKVTFYKKFNLNYIFVVKSIDEIYEELMELADEHARVERFHGLFRDEYWEKIL